MNEIFELTKVDFPSVFISVFVILIGIRAIVSIFEWIVEKLGLETKWIRKQREEHHLLTAFMDEMRNSISEIQSEITQFHESRKHDREQSFQIQKALTDSIKNIVDRNMVKDEQMDNLMIAQREVLADKINDKYKYYITIKGIPEDEVDEFAHLHSAYKGVGGNHSGDAKFEYCMNHLPVIPVETKLITKETE